MKKIFKYSTPFLLSLVLLGCKKEYLETSPSTQAPTELVFATTDGAYVALDGVYRSQFTSLTDHGNFGQKSYDLVSDLMGNDMVVHTAGYGWFNGEYRFTAQQAATDNSRSERTWYFYYRSINNANQIIVNIDNAAGPQADRDNIKGQALALRAFSYFNLINFFQQTYKGNETKPGVPLYLEPTMEGKPRGTVQQVYDQIVADLTEAETLLTGKARRHISNINVNVVQGIRARVALQMEDFPTAATYANKARQGYSLMSRAQYTQGFSTRTNPEWMWGMEVNTEQATIYASFFSHIDETTGGYAALGTQKKITKALYDQIAAGDVRKDVFQGTTGATSRNPVYNQRKFKVPTAGSWAADYLFMRVAEMYLIEAEALARTGKPDEARTVLETMVKARYADYAAPQTGQDLINEILLQRRIELWGEGLSLLDIKRLKTGLNRPTGNGNHGTPNLDAVVYTMPDQDPRFLMRIPQREINANESMTEADQNP